MGSNKLTKKLVSTIEELNGKKLPSEKEFEVFLIKLFA